MDSLIFQTDSCSIGLVGRIHTDRRRPALLIVGGSFAPQGYMHEYVEAFRGASVLVATMPGMGTEWTSPSIEQMRRSFDQLLEDLLPGRATVVCGASTGCLVSLGLRAPTIRRQVAIEPFLTTANLWPFIQNARERLVLNSDQPALADYLWKLFGIAADKVEERDYRYLLRDLQVRTEVLVGDLALLPERPLPQWPSFASELERTYWRNHPLATLHVGRPGSGHGVGIFEGADFVRSLLHRTLHEVAREATEVT